jgi:hypothetical protein
MSREEKIKKRRDFWEAKFQEFDAQMKINNEVLVRKAMREAIQMADKVLALKGSRKE